MIEGLSAPMDSGLIQSVAAASAGLAVLFAVYRSLLPKPLPGIPYNEESAKSIFGDLAAISGKSPEVTRRRIWWAELAKKHDAPLVQFFFGLGMKPGIVVADYREARDLLLRRGRELVRGTMNCELWLGIIPAHFIAMDDGDPHFKGSRALGKDLMGSGFLHSVSCSNPHSCIGIKRSSANVNGT